MLRIEALMNEKNIGVTELAERLNVSRQTIYYYIKQDIKNPVSQLFKIAEALEVPVIELFPTKDNKVHGYIKISNDIHEINSFSDLEKLLNENNKESSCD